MSAGSRAVKVTAKTTLKGKELSSVIAGLAVILSVFVVYLTASLLSIAVGEIAATVIYAVACVLLIMPLVYLFHFFLTWEKANNFSSKEFFSHYQS